MSERRETSTETAAKFLALRYGKRKRGHKPKAKKRSLVKGKPACQMLRIQRGNGYLNFVCACGRVGGGLVSSCPDARAVVLRFWRSHARSKLIYQTRRAA